MLARLHKVGSRLWLKRDLRQALDEILAGAIELLGADTGIVRILDPIRDVLKIEAHRGVKQEFIDLFLELPVAGESACARALRLGERIVIADVERDAPATPSRSLTRAAGYRAMQSTPIRGREGKPLGVLSTHFRSVHKPDPQDLRLLDVYVRQAADIIDCHEAENALRTSEERLRLAQLKTGIGIWDWDLRTGKLTWTPELEVLFGLEPGTVRSYADFRDRVLPEDIAGIEAGRDAAVRCRETFNLEFRIMRSDGQVRWISATGGAFYDATGEPIRIIGNNADITARKRAELALQASEAKFSGILEIAGDAIVSINTNHRIALFNGAAERLFGYSRGEMLGQSLDLLIPARFRAVHQQHIACFTASPDIVRCMGDRQEVIGRRKNGEEFPTEASISKLKTGGEWVYTIVLRDITERKRAEERQRVLVAELDHRVKNVLANVSAIVSHSQEECTSVTDFAAALDGRIRSMATTHELLSSGRWQGVSLTEIVRCELAPYATRDNIQISGPEVVLCPEAAQAMAMVVHELATNAAKYGALSTSRGRVSMRWHRQMNGRARAHLVLEWREMDGPQVIATGQRSYGTSTICDLIPYEFGGTVDLLLVPDGVRCHLELPADWLINDSETAFESHSAG